MSIVLVTVIAAGVTHNGGPVAIGEVLELSELSASALLREGLATQAPVDPIEPPGDDTPPADPPGDDTPPGDDLPPAPPAGDDDEAERFRKALDAQYNLEDGKKPGIKAAAQNIGVEFAFDATKAEIIQAVIEQGKAEALAL